MRTLTGIRLSAATILATFTQAFMRRPDATQTPRPRPYPAPRPRPQRGNGELFVPTLGCYIGSHRHPRYRDGDKRLIDASDLDRW